MSLHNTANQLDRIDVVTAADMNGVNFEKLASEGVKTYHDFEEMLEKESLDIIIVATPISSHYQVASRVLDFSITGLYLEKSMATRLWEADQLVQKADEFGIYLVVGHQLRYNQGWANVRNLIDQDAIGQLHYIRAHRGAAMLTHESRNVITQVILVL